MKSHFRPGESEVVVQIGMSSRYKRNRLEINGIFIRHSMDVHGMLMAMIWLDSDLAHTEKNEFSHVSVGSIGGCYIDPMSDQWYVLDSSQFDTK